MLSREDNDRLTLVGPGTPMGNLMRRYWVPILYSAELPAPDCPPKRVKILCEKLVAFRDTQGRVGLLDERCPHRTASLFFGRNEECGIRCVYHGWKFDVEGNCVDLPSEPWDKDFKRKIKITAYPCIERGSLVWAYMGPPGKQPEFPDLEWTMLPPSHLYVSRHIMDCNWLQAVEGGFDTSHLAFLHQGTVGAFKIERRYEAVATDFGFIAATGREPQNGIEEWSANAFLMPFHKLISHYPLSGHVWAPIDDETTMNWSMNYNPTRPLSDEEQERSLKHLYIHTENIPGTDRCILNKDNNYLIDRALQASGKSYTGIKGVGMQDCAIQESMGPIADRTIEHLGVSDTLIIKIRRILLQTLRDMDNGIEPPGLNPRSWRVRSGRFTIPEGADFRKAVEDFVTVREPVPAE